MRKTVDGVEIELSSGNIYSDLGFINARRLKIKSGLAIKISKAMRDLGLSQEAAGRRMGLTQSKVSGLLRGDFTNISERKLMDCLNKLGFDIEITVKPATESVGRLVLTD